MQESGWLSSLSQNLLSNAIWYLMGLGGVALLTYLRKRHSAWLSPILFGLTGGALMLAILISSGLRNTRPGTAGIVLISALLMGAFLMFAASRVSDGAVTKPESTNHDECQRTIGALESEKERLDKRRIAAELQATTKERDIADLKGQLETCRTSLTTFSARVEQARGEASNAQAQLTEAKWVIDRAKHQGSQIDQVITVTELRIGQHELQRRDPYFEMVVVFLNRSIFDIEVMDLVGTLVLQDREFREPIQWTQPQRRVVWSQNVETYYFRQELTDEDVDHIRKSRAYFHFAKLELSVKGTEEMKPYVKPHRMAWGGTIPTNEALINTLGESWVRKP